MNEDFSERVEVVDEIWSKDKLNRKSYADFLYRVIKTAKVNNDEDNALIFSIDGEWGSGKSFFIDLWQQQLEKDGHLVSRFDAWKNDIIDDPLIGFISHVYTEISKWQDQLPIDSYMAGQVKERADAVINTAKDKMLSICTEIVKGMAKKGAAYLITEEAVDFVLEQSKHADDSKETVENAVALQLIENKIVAHNKNIEIIDKFKEELSKTAFDLTKSLGKQKPVVVFIDELDRCRPDYAVRLLEVLKHIFNSKGICFVASANITQLEHSIKTIYGAGFDAELYLDRFFNYRLLLPKPSIEDYVKSMSYFDDLDAAMSAEFEKLKNLRSRYTSNYLMTNEGVKLNNALQKKHHFIIKVCEIYELNLREINNLFGKLKLISDVLKEQWKDMYVMYDLVFLILTFVHKNKKVKRDDFNFINGWSERDTRKINGLSSESLIIYGDSNFKIITLEKTIKFFHYIKSKVAGYIIGEDERDAYHENAEIFYSAMRINHSSNEANKIVLRILDSYIDACFMAATIDPRKDVVLD